MKKEITINLNGDIFTGTATELESGKFDPETFMFSKDTLRKLNCFGTTDHYFKVLDIIVAELDDGGLFEGSFQEEHNDCMYQL